MSIQKFIYINNDGYEEELFVDGLCIRKSCDVSAAVGDLVVESLTVDDEVDVVSDNTDTRSVFGVIVNKPSTTSADILIKGTVEGLTSLSQSKKIFLSANGKITTSLPTNNYLQILGWAVSSSKIYFNPVHTKIKIYKIGFNSPLVVTSFAPGTISNNDEFGYDVAISGNRCVIGSYKYDGEPGVLGAVFIYDYNEGTDSWDLSKTIKSGTDFDEFGRSVALYEDLVIIGVPEYNGTNNGCGKAEIYKYNGSDWVLQTTLSGSGSSGEGFGKDVDIWNDFCVVTSDSHEARYFYNTSGSTWNLSDTISSADNCCIGTTYSILSRNGTIYLFKRTGNSWGSSLDSITKDIYFGRDVSVHGTKCIASRYSENENSGAAYIYDISGDSFSEEQVLYGDIGGNDRYTRVLIHSDDDTESSEFVDSSSSGKIITANGDVHHETDQHKFGSSSIHFDGTEDYLNFSDSDDFDLSTDNFTFDCWIYIDSHNGSWRALLNKWYYSPNRCFWFGLGQNNKLAFIYSTDGSGWTEINSNTVLSTGQWVHIAFVRKGSDINFFVDGTNDGSGTLSGNIYNSTNKLYIGVTAYDESDDPFTGYVDEIRFSKGIARYTSNFTPKNSVYDLDDGDDFFTKLLIHSNSEDGNTDFKDSASYKNHKITANGDVHHETDQHKFGSSSIYFDGNGDYLDIDGFFDFNFYTEDFTIDFWMRLDEIDNTSLIELGEYNSNGLLIRIEEGASNRLTVYVGGIDYNFSFSWSIDTWYHVAVVRDGNNLRCFINGSSIGVADISGKEVSNVDTVRIGWILSGAVNGGSFKGYFDEIRISKGISRWTSNFIPKSNKYDTTDGNDQYTKLLIHSDTYDGCTSFIDNSYGKSMFFVNGDVHHETDQYKFGSSSIYFDGAGDSITFPSDKLFFGNKTFTIDWWEYRINNGDGRSSFITQEGRSHPGILAGYSSNGNVLYVYLSSDGSGWAVNERTLNDSVPLNQWVHYAIVRDGDTFYLFANGVQKDTFTYSGSIYFNINEKFCIGKATWGDFQGYIDEFRISFGIARYTSSFTPNSKPYDTLIGGSYFGHAVGITDGAVIVGCYKKNNNKGGIYIYESSGSVWSETGHYDGIATNGELGFAVDISNSKAIAGAHNENSEGKAYIIT